MGAYLPNPDTTKLTSFSSSLSLQYAASQQQGWRTSMQDAYLLDTSESQALFGVFDGHGGKQLAIYLSNHFASVFRSSPHYYDKRYEIALKQTFTFMDTQISTPQGQADLYRIQRDLPSDYTLKSNQWDSLAGSTALIVFIKSGKIYTANAGDSRCVLFKDGQAKSLSRDHRPYLQSQLERITRAGGYIQDGRVMGKMNVTRGIGDLEYKNNKSLGSDHQVIIALPEVQVQEIDERCQFLVLATDGVWDMMTDQDCTEFIQLRLKAGIELNRIVQEVLDQCLAEDAQNSGGLGCDNAACIIVKFSRQMEVFLTGATGTIGKSVLKLLIRKGMKVKCQVRSNQKGDKLVRRFGQNCSYIVLQFRVDNFIEIKQAATGFDYIVNTAFSHKSNQFQIETVSISALLEAAQQTSMWKQTGFIMTSESLVYGNSDQIVTENSPIQPFDFQETRINLQYLVLNSCSGSLFTSVVRPGWVYWNSYLDKFILRCKKNRAVVGPAGDKWISVIHREDLAQVYAGIIEGKLSGIFNATQFTYVSVKALLIGIAKVLRYESFQLVDDVLPYYRKYGFCIWGLSVVQKIFPQRAFELFQFQPVHSFLDELEKYELSQ